MLQKLNLTKSLEMFEEAKRLSPGGVQGIRRPYNFIEGEYPIFITHGKGGYIYDVDGNRYMDMLCAYGPIILGYVESEIDHAVIEQLRKGFCFSLCQPLQNKLLKKLTELIPCAEMGVIVKTGSDATTAAIRVARAYTGKTEILRCGYHGWHDWCVEVKGGALEDAYKHTHEFHYNKIDELEALLTKLKGSVAGIIITPVGHPLSAPVEAPAPGYLEAVRKLADDHKVVLIFDEIRSGFRVAMGGAQARYKVTPDVAVFGKAMANGYSISAVVGKKEFMSVYESKAFISSTFFPNSLEMCAAMKTIEILERDNVLDKIWDRGTMFLAKLREIVAASGIDCEVSGLPPIPFLTFNKDSTGRYKEIRKKFYTGTIRRGLFIQPFHHWYICYRHAEADLMKALEIIEDSLKEAKE